MIDQMLEFKKQLQKAKTDRDKTYYERKCCKSAVVVDSLDKQIDFVVYKSNIRCGGLYNLTEKEIKIIEG